MNTLNKWIRPVLFGFLAACLVSCASVSHVSELHNARNDFNDATDSQNINVLRAAFPHKPPGVEDFNQGSELDAETLYLKYADISARLKLLLETKTPELQADKLYVNARVLKLMSEWKKIYYGQLMLLEKEEDQQKGDIKIAGSFVAIIDEANALKEKVSKDESLKEGLFPGNMFILQTLEPLIRYDNALVQARRARAEGALKDKVSVESRLEKIERIIETMAKEEKNLAAVKDDNFNQGKRFNILSRITMLNTGVVILKYSGLQAGGLLPKFPEFVERHKNLRKELENKDLTEKYGIVASDLLKLDYPWPQ